MSKVDPQLSLDEFSQLMEQLITSEKEDHRDLYLSLRDPIGFIDKLIRLHHDVEQGTIQNNTPLEKRTHPPHASSAIKLASSGITEPSLDEQFPALPAELTLQVEPDGQPIHGHHVLRWVNTETAQVDYMSRIHITGGNQQRMIIDTGPLGGETGAWHLELYQAGDGLPRVGRVPITVGPNHQANRRRYTP